MQDSVTFDAKTAMEAYRNAFEQGCSEFLKRYPETELYAPVRYLMALGGKRLRPVLVMAACEASGGRPEEALPAALAVELFHNFTLMHDDIMDDAPLRRGMPTVHEKWNDNTAILSGDALHVMACEALLDAPDKALPDLLRSFHRTALEVCEGQEQDMAFESRRDVTIEEYMEMIRLKTSVLLAAALEMGGKSAGADDKPARPCTSLGCMWGWPSNCKTITSTPLATPKISASRLAATFWPTKRPFCSFAPWRKPMVPTSMGCAVNWGNEAKEKWNGYWHCTAIWVSMLNCATRWRAKWPWLKGHLPV